MYCQGITGSTLRQSNIEPSSHHMKQIFTLLTVLCLCAFNVSANDAGHPVSISPAAGSRLKELQTIVFEFSKVDYPNTMDYDSSKAPVLYNEAGEEVTIGHFGFADASTYMSLNVTLEQRITQEGVYTLKIPAGAMREYGWGIENPMQCPALELTYTISNVEPQYTIKVTPSPEQNATLDDITEFTITFDGVQKIDLTFATCGTTCGSPWFAYMQRLDENGNSVEDFGTECVKISDVAYTATIIGTPTEEGTYRLTIPEGVITILDNDGISGPVKETTFDYNVESVSVEDIFAEATSSDVYTLDGVCVLRNANADDIKLLEKGIYIINGCKVVIR